MLLEKEEVEELVNIDDETMKIRITAIREKLEDIVVGLRKYLKTEEIENSEFDDKDIEYLNSHEQFKAWVISNLVLRLSDSDVNNQNINRLLYFMFDEYEGDVRKIISSYDVEILKTEDGSLSYQLKVLEPNESEDE